jgi:hypothetical protein
VPVISASSMSSMASAVVPQRRLRFRNSRFPMTLLDLAVSVLGVIAIAAGVILLGLGTSDVAGSSLIGLGVALVPMALYTAHERRNQDEQYADQVSRLSGLDFVVDPPRMTQIANAAEMGKTMFAQSGPNVSQGQIDEYTKNMRLSALALGGSVPAVFESMLDQQLWPRRLFAADGSPAGGAEDLTAVHKIEHAINVSVDYVVSKAFRVGWQLQFALSQAAVRKHDQSDRMQSLTDVIFDAKIAESLQIVSRGSNLGPKVCLLTTEVLPNARIGLVALDDFISFLIFLQWFTASLARAYPWDPWYETAIMRADELLDQVRNPSSSAKTSPVFTELARVLAI